MKPNGNAIIILILTGFVGTLADTWTLILCALFGSLVAIISLRRFFFSRVKSNLLVLVIALLAQYIIQTIFGVGYTPERIAFMVSPMIFLFVMRLIAESKYRVLIEHKARMFIS
jgi:hypothetical protein